MTLSARRLAPRKRPRELESHAAFLIGASAVAMAACAKLGEDVFNNESGPFDKPIRKWVLRHQTPILDAAFLAITRAASPAVIIPATLAGSVWLSRRRGLPIAGAVMMSPAIAVAIFLAVKRIYRRERPAGGKRLHQLTYAFPSGHSTASAAIFGTTSYVLYQEDMISRPVAIAAATIAPLLVGASRVYLDVHWTTDVLGGWSVGSLVAALSAGVYERVRDKTRRHW